jgi:hypothetical protein
MRSLPDASELTRAESGFDPDQSNAKAAAERKRAIPEPSRTNALFGIRTREGTPKDAGAESG